jgi:hypothetical protein
VRSHPPSLRPFVPVGYCIGNDQYFKRDDVGIIYQMNVVPGERRKLVGATLIKAIFDRAAYGCRLFCCWCAQDIEANYFWESLGFIPLAFRVGSREKDRVHIFWQRRIRPDDTTTPYWFPAQTSSGAIREDRIVLPIPPGTHWRDVMPRVLPEDRVSGVGSRVSGEEQRRLSGSSRNPKPETRNPSLRQRVGLGPPPSTPQADAVTVRVGEKPKREKKPKAKNDPKLVAAARELRDRWLEHINSGAKLLDAQGKYDVSRQLESRAGEPATAGVLPAARWKKQLPPPTAA